MYVVKKLFQSLKLEQVLTIIWGFCVDFSLQFAIKRYNFDDNYHGWMSNDAIAKFSLLIRKHPSVPFQSWQQLKCSASPLSYEL